MKRVEFVKSWIKKLNVLKEDISVTKKMITVKENEEEALTNSLLLINDFLEILHKKDISKKVLKEIEFYLPACQTDIERLMLRIRGF